jgi:hypothetical protein
MVWVNSSCSPEEIEDLLNILALPPDPWGIVEGGGNAAELQALIELGERCNAWARAQDREVNRDGSLKTVSGKRSRKRASEVGGLNFGGE